MSDVLPLRTDVPEAPARKRRRRLLPLVVDARRLARLLSSSLRAVRRWDSAGQLPRPVRIGGRVVWSLREIRDWVAAGCPARAEWEAVRAARK